MRFSSLCLVGAAAAIVCGVTATTAKATIQAIFTDVGNSITVGPVTGTNNPGVGSSLVISPLPVGAFSIQLYDASSNSGAVPPPGLDQLNATALLVQNISGAPDLLQIQLSDINFAPPATGQPLSLSESGSVTFQPGSPGNLVTLQSFADPSNTQFNQVNPTPVSSVIWTSPGTFPLPVESTTLLPVAGPLSVTDVLNLSLNPGDIVNLSYTTSVAPEPTPFAMLAMGSVLLLGKRIKSAGKKALK